MTKSIMIAFVLAVWSFNAHSDDRQTCHLVMVTNKDGTITYTQECIPNSEHNAQDNASPS